MGKITSTTELKNAIQILEAEQHAKRLELKEHFSEIYMRFNPISLIMNTLNDAVNSQGISEKLIVGGVGLISGYFTRRIVVGSSTNIYKKLLGSAIQYGATSLVSQNAGTIKMIGQYLYDQFLSKKKNGKDE